MPKDEGEPIASDEELIRRFWYTNLPVGKPLKADGMKPREGELEGISLFRLSCQNAIEDVLESVEPSKRDFYGLVAIPVASFYAKELSILPDPDIQVRGHVLIPEINPRGWAEDLQNLRARLALLLRSDCVRILKQPSRRDYDKMQANG